MSSSTGVVSAEEGVSIRIGDALAELAKLPAESVHCVITSPPYFGLRDYGTQVWEGGDTDCQHERQTWDGPKQTGRAASGHAAKSDRLDRQECRCGARRTDGQIGLEDSPTTYVARLLPIFRELRRVLRKDGTLWLNMGDSFAQKGGQKADGAELAADAVRAQEKQYPTAAFAGYKGWQRASGTAGGLLKSKDLIMMPHRLAIALQEDGWYVRMDCVWAKNNPMPESTRDRPTRSHEYMFLLSKRARYYYDSFAVREKAVDRDRRCGSVTGRGRTDYAAVRGGDRDQSGGFPRDGVTRNRRSVWAINARPYAAAHFATFPPALVTPCLKAGTSERGVCPQCGAPWKRLLENRETGRFQKMADGWDTGAGGHGTIHRNGREKGEAGKPVMEMVSVGWTPTCAHDDPPVPAIVLDPFAGSGTVGEVALRLGRRAILIDLQEEYRPLMEARLKKVQTEMAL